MTTESLGSWVCLYDTTTEGMWTIQHEDEPRIDAGVSRWIESGSTVDTLLDLTTLDGFPLRIRASTVYAWFVSTPGGRRRAIELQKLQDEERKANRQAVGLWDEADG